MAQDLLYAGVPYLDRTRALEDGTVTPDGFRLRFWPITIDLGVHFAQMCRWTPYDAAEMSLSTFAVLTSQGDDRYVGLPVFPSRAFRQSQVYINSAAGIEGPEDLRGRNVGVPSYQMTAAVWIRAFLKDDYGVDSRELRWWTGGLKTPAYEQRQPHDVPDGVHLERIPAEDTLEEMLADGRLDALATANEPEHFRRGDSRVTRLFPDYRSVEEDYHRRTGIFPIMHMVVLRRDVYERRPEVAVALADAFERARRWSVERWRELDTLGVSHPWPADELDRMQAQFDGDPFAYGLERNRHVLEALCAHAHEQGLTGARVPVADLFAPETHAWAPEAVSEARG